MNFSFSKTKAPLSFVPIQSLSLESTNNETTLATPKDAS